FVIISPSHRPPYPSSFPPLLFFFHLPANTATYPLSLHDALPISLGSPHGSVQATGLLDSGATINVLPHDLGIQLGLDWRQQQRYGIQLTGNLANYHARGVALDLVIGPFPAVRQVFAWTQATNVPLILGRINFF